MPSEALGLRIIKPRLNIKATIASHDNELDGVMDDIIMMNDDLHDDK